MAIIINVTAEYGSVEQVPLGKPVLNTIGIPLPVLAQFTLGNYSGGDFVVEASQTPTFDVVNYFVIASEGNTASFANIPLLGTWYFRGRKDFSGSVNSDRVEITFIQTPVIAPEDTQLVITANAGDGEATITHNCPTDNPNIDYISVKRRELPSGTFAEVGTFEPTATAYVDTPLTNDQAYQWQFDAIPVNANNTISSSNTSNATPTDGEVQLSTPTGIFITQDLIIEGEGTTGVDTHPESGVDYNFVINDGTPIVQSTPTYDYSGFTAGDPLNVKISVTKTGFTESNQAQITRTINDPDAEYFIPEDYDAVAYYKPLDGRRELWNYKSPSSFLKEIMDSTSPLYVAPDALATEAEQQALDIAAAQEAYDDYCDAEISAGRYTDFPKITYTPFTQMTNADNDALSTVGPLTLNSSSEHTIETGIKTFTYPTASPMGWKVGIIVKIKNGSNWMEGKVTAISSTSMTVSINTINGSGTFSSWQIVFENFTKITTSVNTFSVEDEGKRFCGRDNHFNGPLVDDIDAYIPNAVSARYANVCLYVSPTEIYVDFEFNGGNITTPQIQTNGKGYIFHDNTAAFNEMFTEVNAASGDKLIRFAELTYSDKLMTAYIAPLLDPPPVSLTNNWMLNSLGTRSRVKYGIEDYYYLELGAPDTTQAYPLSNGDLTVTTFEKTLFRLTGSLASKRFVTHNVQFVAAHGVLAAALPQKNRLVNGTNNNLIAFVNTQSGVERDAIILANREGLSVNSSTSNIIGMGSKTFTYSTTTLGWPINTIVKAVSGSNWMEGNITAISPTELTFTVKKFSGTGTYTSWNLKFSLVEKFVLTIGDVSGGTYSSANSVVDPAEMHDDVTKMSYQFHHDFYFAGAWALGQLGGGNKGGNYTMANIGTFNFGDQSEFAPGNNVFQMKFSTNTNKLGSHVQANGHLPTHTLESGESGNFLIAHTAGGNYRHMCYHIDKAVLFADFVGNAKYRGYWQLFYRDYAQALSNTYLNLTTTTTQQVFLGANLPVRTEVDNETAKHYVISRGFAPKSHAGQHNSLGTGRPLTALNIGDGYVEASYTTSGAYGNTPRQAKGIKIMFSGTGAPTTQFTVNSVSEILPATVPKIWRFYLDEDLTGLELGGAGITHLEEVVDIPTMGMPFKDGLITHPNWQIPIQKYALDFDANDLNYINEDNNKQPIEWQILDQFTVCAWVKVADSEGFSKGDIVTDTTTNARGVIRRIDTYINNTEHRIIIGEQRVWTGTEWIRDLLYDAFTGAAITNGTVTEDILSASTFDPKVIHEVVRKQVPNFSGSDYSLDQWETWIDVEDAFLFSSAKSTTSATIGLGSKTLTYPSTAVGWVNNTIIRATSGTAWMEGTITSVSATGVTFNVTSINESGTYNDWYIKQTGGTVGGGEIKPTIPVLINGTINAKVFFRSAQSKRIALKVFDNRHKIPSGATIARVDNLLETTSSLTSELINTEGDYYVHNGSGGAQSVGITMSARRSNMFGSVNLQGYYYSDVKVSPALPDDANDDLDGNPMFDIEMIKSECEYLLDGNLYDACHSYLELNKYGSTSLTMFNNNGSSGANGSRTLRNQAGSSQIGYGISGFNNNQTGFLTPFAWPVNNAGSLGHGRYSVAENSFDYRFINFMQSYLRTNGTSSTATYNLADGLTPATVYSLMFFMKALNLIGCINYNVSESFAGGTGAKSPRTHWESMRRIYAKYLADNGVEYEPPYADDGLPVRPKFHKHRTSASTTIIANEADNVVKSNDVANAPQYPQPIIDLMTELGETL
jgi:hypothetical protein